MDTLLSVVECMHSTQKLRTHIALKWSEVNQTFTLINLILTLNPNLIP